MNRYPAAIPSPELGSGVTAKAVPAIEEEKRRIADRIMRLGEEIEKLAGRLTPILRPPSPQPPTDPSPKCEPVMSQMASELRAFTAQLERSIALVRTISEHIEL